MNPAIRANGVRYWLALTRNTIAYYWRQRRWAALGRAVWLVLVLGYYLEVCERCGRKVGLVWHANDALYQRATAAGAAGIFCPACFTILAERVTPDGYLVWQPIVRQRAAP